jgi:ubiquinol-cytochrome c reductase cytochrome c subunit
MTLLRSLGRLNAAPAFVTVLMAAGASSIAAQTPAAQAPAATAPSGSVDKGRTTFAKVGCAQCHGLEAQGSPTTGPRLGPGALPYAAFSRLVRTPRLQMPPYTEKVLSNTDLADIYAFVQSRPKPTLPPLLQP